MTDSERSAKKRKADDEEDDLLNQLVDDDDFISEEELQRREAEKRRHERRKRLQKIQEKETIPPPPPPLPPPQQAAKDDMKQESQANNPVNKNQETNNEDDAHLKDDDDGDEYDMFSSSVSPVVAGDTVAATGTKRGHEQEDWDDTEGYYKAVIGETIELVDNSISFRVAGNIGKGVFSTVLKCQTVNNSSSTELPPTVALKCIRHNDTMAKAALSELQILHRLKGSPGIVPLLLPTTATTNNNNSVADSSVVITPLEYRGHVTFVFPFMEYNLRDVLQKFGKGVGLSLQAVRSYFGQLLAASTHLQKHGIIHADLKPDNILVSADFGVVQLADFGSAIEAAAEQTPTPYLVSRFYRAPEIILGLTPTTYAIDLWSLAVTVAELFLGDVLFHGRTNNDMLYVMQQHMGAFSNRVIRQHLVTCQKFLVPAHFQQQEGSKTSYYYFTQQTVDPVTGVPVHKPLSLSQHHNNQNSDNNSNNNKFPLATPLHSKLMKAKSAKESRRLVQQFSDLLQKCLALDPSKRIALKDALRHDFFQAPAATATGSSTTTVAK